MKKVIYISLCILFIAGCKDDDPVGWTRYEYLDEARDYIYFKPGTWWVYKRVPGEELDTIEVFDSWIDTVKLIGDGNTLYYEHLEWKAKSKLDNYTYTFGRGPTILPDPTYATDFMITRKQYGWSKSRPGNYGGERRLFLYPFDTSWYAPGSVSDIQLVNMLDQTLIQNQLYYDTKIYELSNDGTFIYDELGRRGGRVQYYWAPHVGIIKREHMTKNISWELVESHIVQ